MHRDYEDEDGSWRRIEQLASQEANRHGLTGAWHSLHIATELINKHIRVLKECLDQAAYTARSELIHLFVSIELQRVLSGLLDAIREMLLVYVCSISAGASVGGLLSGGVGIGAGAAVGAELGTLWLSAIGLKCLAEALLKNMALLTADYAHGIAQAWQAVYYDPHSERVVVNEDRARTATWRLTSAHVRMVKALLIAIVVYLSKGQLKTLADEVRSGKLGDTFGNWLEQYGGKLKEHPALQPSTRSVVTGNMPEAAAKKTASELPQEQRTTLREESASDEVKSEPTHKEKAIRGETRGRAYMQQQGFERISRDKRWNERGIDDIWKNSHPPPDYVIAEYKYGGSGLGQTKDGLQMSDGWLDGTSTGFDRIKAVVSEDEALDIDISRQQDRVEKWLLRTDKSGLVSKSLLNAAGKVIVVAK